MSNKTHWLSTGMLMALVTLLLASCGAAQPAVTQTSAATTAATSVPVATTVAPVATTAAPAATTAAPAATTVTSETATELPVVSATPEAVATAGTTATGQDTTPAIVAATNAFLATLSDTEREAVLFDFSDTEQKQRWSNLPEGLFTRDGIRWGDLSETTQNAWLQVMQVTLSTEGYNQVVAEWTADDALATGSSGAAPSPGGTGEPSTSETPSAGSTGGPRTDETPPAGGPGGTPPTGGTPGAGGPGGGQLSYGKQYYWIAIIGTPSETDPWQWQWGGHHVQVNATIVGSNVALTPSFIGVQPGSFTDANGDTVRPLGAIEDDAFALVNALDATQQQTAVLGDASIDVVLGPGQDGKTVEAEGLPGAQMTAEQQAALLKLIEHYTGLINDEDAAARNAEIQATLDETYLAWYGPTTAGSAAYFRISGPTIVIEYSAQGGGGTGLGLGGSATIDHIHGIYRDPTNDYGAKYTQ